MSNVVYVRVNKGDGRDQFIEDFKWELSSNRVRFREGTYQITIEYVKPKKEAGNETDD